MRLDPSRSLRRRLSRRPLCVRAGLGWVGAPRNADRVAPARENPTSSLRSRPPYRSSNRCDHRTPHRRWRRCAGLAVDRSSRCSNVIRACQRNESARRSRTPRHHAGLPNPRGQTRQMADGRRALDRHSIAGCSYLTGPQPCSHSRNRHPAASRAASLSPHGIGTLALVRRALELGPRRDPRRHRSRRLSSRMGRAHILPILTKGRCKSFKEIPR
jgi:hypothetical protein